MSNKALTLIPEYYRKMLENNQDVPDCSYCDKEGICREHRNEMKKCVIKLKLPCEYYTLTTLI